MGDIKPTEYWNVSSCHMEFASKATMTICNCPSPWQPCQLGFPDALNRQLCSALSHHVFRGKVLQQSAIPPRRLLHQEAEAAVGAERAACPRVAVPSMIPWPS